MSDVYVARQPIFDLDQRLVGYELLYRASGAATCAGGASANQMSSSTLVTALLAIGLEELTGGARAFVNFPRDMLVRRAFELLDPKRITIELLESVACDDTSVAAVEALRLRGFELALDDFAAGDEYDRFLRAAQIVKIDVLGATRESLEPVVLRLKRYRARLLAERIEGPEMYALCRSLGFTLFQGYFLRHPETVGRRDLPPELAAIVRVMNLVADPRATDRDLEAAFRADSGLSYKLLRIANSAAIGGAGVASIQHAVQIVGRSTLHRWLSLLFVSALPTGSGVERELAIEALERGRMCELLATSAGDKRSAAPAFLAGLLSRFDAILGIGMPELLRQVRVTPDVEAALLNAHSPLTPYLAVASLYAQGNWEPTIAMATEMGVLDELLGWYREAGGWARAVLQAA